MALPLAALRERADGDRVTVGGIVAAIRRTSTRKKEPMAFVTLEDLTSQVDVVVFPALLERSRQLIAPDAILLVTGKASWKDEQVTLVADEIRPLPAGDASVRRLEPAEPTVPSAEAVWLHVPANGSRQDLELLRAAIRANPGTVPVYLRFAEPPAALRLGREYAVTPGDPLRRAVEEVLGSGSYTHIRQTASA